MRPTGYRCQTGPLCSHRCYSDNFVAMESVRRIWMWRIFREENSYNPSNLPAIVHKLLMRNGIIFLLKLVSGRSYEIVCTKNSIYGVLINATLHQMEKQSTEQLNAFPAFNNNNMKCHLFSWRSLPATLARMSNIASWRIEERLHIRPKHQTAISGSIFILENMCWMPLRLPIV